MIKAFKKRTPSSREVAALHVIIAGVPAKTRWEKSLFKYLKDRARPPNKVLRNAIDERRFQCGNLIILECTQKNGSQADYSPE